MVASWHGDAAVVRALLDVGADASRVRNIDGATALFSCSGEPRARRRTTLERGRADPSAPGGPCRSTPLIVAAERGHVASVRTLLTAGANPNASDATGWTAGHAACQGGHVAASERFTICEGGPQRASGAGRLHSCFDCCPTKPRRVFGCVSCSRRGFRCTLLDGPPVDAIYYVSA